MLQKNDKMPDFTEIDQYGNEIKSSQFNDKKLIIFFYPKASTPGCTAEACNLNENYDELKKLGFSIIGISADNIDKQLKFSEKYKFQYPLISDENKSIINDFGVWGPKKFMGVEYEGILRTTFIINEQGIIEHIITKVKTKDHTNQILELIK